MRAVVAAVFLLVGAAPVTAEGTATDLLNALRHEQGRAALVYDTRLEAAARAHAEDMADNGFFSHTGSQGSGVGDRVRAAGYRWCRVAENIAQGQRSTAQVIEAWDGSKGHRRNMLDRKLRAFGLARGDNNLWVMVLAAPC